MERLNLYPNDLFGRLLAFVWMLLVLFVHEQGCAQGQTTGAGYFCFEISIPSGDFASNEGDQRRYGMAETGVVLAMDASFGLKGSLGISARLSHMAWNVDAMAITDYLNRDSVQYTALTTYPWKCYNVLLGLNSSHSLTYNNRLIFIFKAMTGFTYTSASGAESLSPQVSTTLYFRQSKSAFSIPIQLGTDLRLDIGRSLSFLVYGSFFYTRAHFKEVGLREGGKVSEIEMNIPISAFQVGFGFGIKPATDNHKRRKKSKGMY